MQCDSGGLTCLTNIAVSSSNPKYPLGMLLRVLHDRLWIEMGLGSLLMIVGWWYAEKQRVEILVIVVCVGNLSTRHFDIHASSLSL